LKNFGVEEEMPIEVVNTASSVVSKWMSNMMGITSDDRNEDDDSYDSIMKQTPTEDEQKVLDMVFDLFVFVEYLSCSLRILLVVQTKQQPRAKRLGLGAKFVPHHNGTLPNDPLSK